MAVKSGDDVITITGCQGTVSGGHPGQGNGLGLIFQQIFGSHGNANGHNNNEELAKTPMTIQIYKNGELTPGTHIRRIGCGQKYEVSILELSIIDASLLPTNLVTYYPKVTRKYSLPILLVPDLSVEETSLQSCIRLWRYYINTKCKFCAQCSILLILKVILSDKLVSIAF